MVIAASACFIVHVIFLANKTFQDMLLGCTERPRNTATRTCGKLKHSERARYCQTEKKNVAGQAQLLHGSVMQ